MKGKITTGKNFKGALNYVLDFKNEKSKNPEIISTNMGGENIQELSQEFNIVSKSKQNIKKPVYHMSLTLPENDGVISKEKWDDIINSHFEKMGIDKNNHQFIAVRHKDTNHDHIHIILNKIGLNGKVYHPQNDVFKIIKSTNELEDQFNLTKTKTFKSDFDDNKETDFKDDIKTQLNAFFKKKDTDKNTSSFIEFMKKRRIKLLFNYSKKTDKVSGLSFSKSNETYKGSDLKFSWKLLAKKLNFKQDEDFKAIKEYAESIKPNDAKNDSGGKNDDVGANDDGGLPPTTTNPFDLLKKQETVNTYTPPKSTPQQPRSRPKPRFRW